jgi:ubiquinone/menaquinone biosynthesis C-methylase UbiE
MDQTELSNARFGAAATAYLGSAVHAQGADLRRLTELARDNLSALDLGCGAGHVSYALAEGGANVVAYDPSPEMLAVVDTEARRRGLAAIRTQQGAAEHLPFTDASFDLVVTRFSAHHWFNVAAALVEARRVLKAGGTLVVIDVIAPESPLCDTILQTVEILRDASHVRDYRVSEWRAMLQAAGFHEPAADAWRLRMDFEVWTARMKTPPLRVQAIRDVFTDAAAEARAHFEVEADSSFFIDVAWMQTTARE